MFIRETRNEYEDASVLVYKNHLNADVEVYGLQLLVCPIYHHSPEKIPQ